MATIDFPSDLVEIRAPGYRAGRGNDVRRTEFEDGFVEQRKSNSLASRRREFEIIVKQSNFAEFDRWLDNNGHRKFNFSPFEHNIDVEDAESATTYDARIVGGAGSLSFELQDRTYEDEHFFLCNVVIEWWR